MTFLNITTQNLTLLAATLLTGLSAGVLFIWANTITPGLGKLDNLSYLKAFQQMNRTILNPWFLIVFVGAGGVSLVSIFFSKTSSVTVLGLLIAATVIYFFGVLLITATGNIPLNNLLDKANLESMNLAEAQNLRGQFEARWNNFHLARTIFSTLSFLLLALACLFRNHSV